ncbi:MAG TPA: lamin tail domain-containing protein [Thermoanaerobaculia bacterium]|nr:lamin tail domain-containing protein [Thermoanaerobaculia bacterium]
MRRNDLRPFLLAALLLAAAPAAAQHLRIYYPDIEQGSSTLVVSPTGKALLVDAGTELKVADDVVEDFVNDLIDAGVVASVDYVIASHYDEDHIGRLDHFFQLVPLASGAIAYDRGEEGGTPSSFAYSDYSYGASFHNRTTITATTSIDLGGGVTVVCYVVNGDLPDSSEVDISGSAQFENSASVAVVVHYGDVDVWIGGDLTGNPDEGVTDVESETAPFVGDVDVYTVNHHGSHTSSNATFLGILKAEVAINQNSASNDFGHPRATVVQRFLDTLDTDGNTPLFYQQNASKPGDTRSDDTLAAGIADCDDVEGAFGMPGTMLLISDGSSYELSGCGLGRLAFPADSGAGTPGDFPPAILEVSRSPLVPLSTEGVVVSARVADSSSPTVRLRYWLGGVEQTPLSMTLASGVYSATIPAQSDGTQVRFRVEAEDSAAQESLSPAHGYYSGVTPISTLRANDSNGVLVPKHYGVRVEGNLTAEPGLFHPFVTQAYVQDATGGVQIFDGDLLSLSRGDLVRFVGELEQFAGQTELNISENWGNFGHTLVSSGSAPSPQLVTVSQVGESLEGKLVRINGLTVVAGTIPEGGGGSLTVTDNGGVNTLTVRVDEDTDVPGADTPLGTFDLIGIVSQFDSWVPFASGYQLTPRERTDFVSDEVNHPALIVHEIHADPHSSLGDANGDGVVNTTADEFVELVNTGYVAIDISGYTISDALQTRHTFASGTVIPPREAVVVFAGGTPTGSFGNAAANGLVFTASTGGLALNNTGDTVTVKNASAVVVQSVTYGSAANNDASLTRSPDWTNTPFVRHNLATGSGGTRFSPGQTVAGAAFTVPPGAVILTEVMYDPSGSDGGLEWVELYNTTGSAIDLSSLSLGSGGADWTASKLQLSGTIAAGSTFVVGGPTSSTANGSPTYDLVLDFDPDLQNSGADADGMALFNLRAAFVTSATVPVDAVVYGTANTSSLIDETGSASAPEVADAPGGSSVERVDLAGAWQIQSVPNPNEWTAGGGPPPSALPILSEVMYDPTGADDGLEWVELYNPTGETIDLSGFSLGSGGGDYTSTKVQLSGSLAPGATWVVGGATSSSANGNPTFDQTVNFSPDLQNSGTEGDGVALFAVSASLITSTTVPIDAVVYGPNNNNGLIDETGSANAPEVGDASSGSSIERTSLAGAWQIQSTPTPNTTPLP